MQIKVRILDLVNISYHSCVFLSMRDQIIAHYIRFSNKNGKAPVSVFQFCEDCGLSERQFFDEFSDFEHLQEEILGDFWKNTVAKLEEQEFYQNTNDAEKFLAVAYGFFENLKDQRSFFLNFFGNWNSPKDFFHGFKNFREVVMKYIDQLDLPSTDLGVPQLNKPINKLNSNALYLNLIFVLHYWVKDRSKGFEKTDALIEKLFTLSFDMMETNSLKKVIDLGKFLVADFKL